MDQAPFAAGQNNGHTLMPKASGCYGAHHRRSPGPATKHMNVPSAALVKSTVIAIQRETTMQSALRPRCAGEVILPREIRQPQFARVAGRRRRTSVHMQVSGPCALWCHWQTSCARLEGLRRNAAGLAEVRIVTVASPKPMRALCCWSNIMSDMAPFSSACMSAVKMAASRYRRISTLGNCVTFVIFPAAAGSAPAPQQPRN
jgi:hypothetical protein